MTSVDVLAVSALAATMVATVKMLKGFDVWRDLFTVVTRRNLKRDALTEATVETALWEGSQMPDRQQIAQHSFWHDWTPEDMDKAAERLSALGQPRLKMKRHRQRGASTDGLPNNMSANERINIRDPLSA